MHSDLHLTVYATIWTLQMKFCCIGLLWTTAKENLFTFWEPPWKKLESCTVSYSVCISNRCLKTVANNITDEDHQTECRLDINYFYI